MARRRNRDAKRRSSRQVLGMAIAMLGMSLLFFVLPMMLGSGAAPKAMGKGLRAVAPYPLFAGVALLVLYALLRQVSSSSPSRNESALFGGDSTEFGPQASAAKPASEAAIPIQHRGQRPPATQWSARVFDDIEWRRFEELCASLFAQAGFEARSQSHGADGGVDIWLHSKHSEGPAAVVQCKHWLGKSVGVKELREFYGVMASHKLQRGTFATTSTYTPDARQFAKDNGINALDGQGLLALISTRTKQQQDALLKIAYEGEYWRPTCASCGIKMVERSTRKDGKLFWGCADYPRCRSTLPLRKAA
jgi:restriction system protein